MMTTTTVGGSGGGGGSGGVSVKRVAPPTLQALPMFNSPPLSLVLKPKTESLGELGMMGESFDPCLMGRGSRDDEYESRSGSENLEGGASGDDQEAPGDKSAKRKKYHRHTPLQIQELESAFKENPHPDDKARLDLGRRLNLESKQVKFWFQNRRTQMKTQLERHENAILKQENDKLRIENIALKDALNTAICSQCGGQTALGELNVEDQRLRIENARLREEMNRMCAMMNKFSEKPFLSFPGPMAPPQGMGTPGLELGVGRSNFGDLNPVENTSLPLGLDFGNGISSGLPLIPPRTAPAGVDAPPSVFVELAFTAMNELLKLAEIGDPLWYRSIEGFGETMNVDEYDRAFHSCLGMRPPNFITEANRLTGTVMFNGMAVVETLMDVNRWAEVFAGIVGRTSIIDVLSSNSNASRNGTLQMMDAELQILSPLVPIHHVKFLRFCKQHSEGFWAVVDVSVDMIREGTTRPQELQTCRILPSGCIVQDLQNGCSKVIWIQHMEYDETMVHHFFRPLIRSGMVLGAQRWFATFQRNCECLAVLMSSSIPPAESSVISQGGRRSMATLAQRMTRSFCAVICENIYKWEQIRTATPDNGGARLSMRKSLGEPGDPPGVVMSATKTAWLPIPRQSLFDFLRNEDSRHQWDVLSNGTLQQMIHISKGHDPANRISLYRNTASASTNQNSMFMLQESCSDLSGDIITYASIGAQEMTLVMNGGDSSRVALLPSGFSIMSDCCNNSGWDESQARQGNNSSSNATGSLLTVGFQMLVSSLPGAKLTLESVETVNALISRMVIDIKASFHCN